MKLDNRDMHDRQPTLDFGAGWPNIAKQDRDYGENTGQPVGSSGLEPTSCQPHEGLAADGNRETGAHVSEQAKTGVALAQERQDEADQARPSPEKNLLAVSIDRYDGFAAKVIKNVKALDARVESLGRHTYDVLAEVYAFHLMGIQNPERHKTFLDERGVKLTKRTPPELATVKAMYPKERWEECSPTLNNWKRAIMAFQVCGVPPTEVPQWLRNAVSDESGKDVRGYEKVNAVLRATCPEVDLPKTSPDEKFDALVIKRLEASLVTIPATGDLSEITGYGVMICYRDGDNVKILDALDEPDIARRIAMKRWLKRLNAGKSTQ